MITAVKAKEIFSEIEEVIVWEELCYCSHSEIGLNSKHLGLDERKGKVFQGSEIQKKMERDKEAC